MRIENIIRNLFVVTLLCLPLMTCITAPDDGGTNDGAFVERPSFQTFLGPRLKCLISEGSAKFSSGWYDFQSLRFDIAKGQSRDVSLYRARGANKAAFYARFEANGQRLVFCPQKETVPDDEKIDCSSVYALEDDLKYGIKRTLDVPNIIRGGALYCGYDAPGPKGD